MSIALNPNPELPYESSEDGEYNAINIIILTPENLINWLKQESEFVQHWIHDQRFEAKSHTYCKIPNLEGKLDKILMGCESFQDLTYLGMLAKILPTNIYQLVLSDKENRNALFLATLYFGMGVYEFKHYKSSTKSPSKNKNKLLVSPELIKSVSAYLRAIYFIRDLINLPANDLTPETLAEFTELLAKRFDAGFSQIIGEELLAQNYPAIYAVGKGSVHPPRLIDLTWGDKKHPKVTLVGKGVCFDSGGLDIKTASSMALMKKDMGGAAHVLGLAYLIMFFKLPIRLRVLIPAVENAVSGTAYRPGDIISSRQGLHIEIGNTDAEGRLILCDALTEASSENPDVLIDIATLTGAAKVATGTDLPAFFTNNDALAQTLFSLGEKNGDPVWRLPLFTPYRKLLDSSVADINNMGSSSYAGAITAALFLKEFVGKDIASWVHFDIMAWNVSSTASHPEGGEAQCLRTVFEYLQSVYCARSSAG